jgi:hypothetical protein
MSIRFRIGIWPYSPYTISPPDNGMVSVMFTMALITVVTKSLGPYDYMESPDPDPAHKS